MAEKNILIVCGEPSGDLQAGNLAQALLKINPQVKILAVGSQQLRQAGAEIIYDIQGLAVLGFFDALKKLPKFLTLQKFIFKIIKRDKPQAIILVDFSGFNLRLAKKINNKIPVIYYVSPQVWASRRGRVETIKKFIRKLIVLFPFEQEFYRRHGIEVDFVGHPLLDIVKPESDKQEFLRQYGLSSSKATIALLPGSRKSEIKYILPVMLKAAKLINKSIPAAQFLIAKPGGLDIGLYKAGLSGINLDLKIVEDKAYDCLNAADFALVASGTATLETAILEKPFVIVYKLGLLNYLLYRPQVKVPFIGIVNIIAGKEIIPEFIQFQAEPQAIAQEAIDILKDPTRLNRMKNDLIQLKSSLGSPGAASRAAQIILNLI